MLSTLTSPINASTIGTVTQQTGPTEIVRNKKSIPSNVNSTLQSNDTVITAASKATLTFEDETNVKITEQSKLVIDDFVYDPNKKTGKLAMKVALGTARYASGQIAKSNPQTVNIQTPTARIAVRGTDFSMTVDELGRSLVMLLPSCDDKSCVTGAISVSNDAGTIHMDVAYQATYVSSLTSMPSSPQILNIDQSNINNYLIISSPIKTSDTEIASKETKNALDVNFLNKDFLKYDELDKNELDSPKALDINYLDQNLLVNMLDLMTQQMLASFESLAALNQLLPNYAPDLTNIRYFMNDDESKVSLIRSVKHTAIVTVGVEQNATVYINQDGLNVFQKVNNSGTTNITITQR
jgi:hypothetical protein